MARQALDNTLGLPVAYTSDTTLTLPDRTLEYGEVNGIQDAAGNQYLTGEILGDPVAIYYFGQDEYVQDPFTGQWRLIAKRDPLLPEAPDLSPLSNFDVSRVGSCEILETSGPFYNRVYHVSGSVTPDNQWINDNFQEITYSLWIRSKDAFVEKAVITAKTSYEEVTGILRIAIDLMPGEIQQLQPPLPVAANE